MYAQFDKNNTQYVQSNDVYVAVATPINDDEIQVGTIVKPTNSKFITKVLFYVFLQLLIYVYNPIRVKYVSSSTSLSCRKFVPGTYFP